MIPEHAHLLRLYVNGSRRWRGKPLYQAVVAEARRLGLAGASVFLADLSYGVHRQIRDARSEYLFVDIPVVIEVVDAPEQVARLIDAIGPAIDESFATVEPVRVVRYAHHDDDTGGGG